MKPCYPLHSEEERLSLIGSVQPTPFPAISLATLATGDLPEACNDRSPPPMWLPLSRSLLDVWKHLFNPTQTHGLPELAQDNLPLPLESFKKDSISLSMPPTPWLSSYSPLLSEEFSTPPSPQLPR